MSCSSPAGRGHDLDWEAEAAAHCAALARGSEADALAHSGACLLLGAPVLCRRRSPPCDLARQSRRQPGAPAAMPPRRPLAGGEDAWPRCTSWIAAMSAPRVARSSLFHMRMEQRHRATYEERWRLKWRDMAEEARARLQAADPAGPADPAAAAAALARWQRECPAMLNDTRKLMAATLLLLPGQ
jgi:hypothetical protein